MREYRGRKDNVLPRTCLANGFLLCNVAEQRNKESVLRLSSQGEAVGRRRGLNDLYT